MHRTHPVLASAHRPWPARRVIPFALLLIAGGACGLMMFSCAASGTAAARGESPPTGPTPDVPTEQAVAGAEDAPADGSTRSLFERQAAALQGFDLSQAINSAGGRQMTPEDRAMNVPQSWSPPGGGGAEASPPAPTESQAAADARPLHTRTPAAQPAEGASPVDPAARRRALAAEMAGLIEDDSSGVDPFRAALHLALMDSLEPGVADAAIEDERSRMTPDERQSFDALRGVLREVGGDGSLSPADAARIVKEAMPQLDRAQQLSVPTAALCRRVESFGRYTPFGRNVFVSRRPHRAIVYVEVEGFSHRLTDSGGRYEVRLAQTVRVYADSANGNLAWQAPEQTVSDVSSRRRRDFFVSQLIELPDTLTVGRYNLKVTLRDLGSGAEAESVIPFEIVADPGLAASGG